MPVLVPVTTAISILGLLWVRSLGAAFQQAAGRKARRGRPVPGGPGRTGTAPGGAAGPQSRGVPRVTARGLFYARPLGGSRPTGERGAAGASGQARRPHIMRRPTNRLREANEQIAQVGGGRRLAQHRGNAEDLLDRAQRRAVVIGDAVRVAPALEFGRASCRGWV